MKRLTSVAACFCTNSSGYLRHVRHLGNTSTSTTTSARSTECLAIWPRALHTCGWRGADNTCTRTQPAKSQTPSRSSDPGDGQQTAWRVLSCEPGSPSTNTHLSLELGVLVDQQGGEVRNRARVHHHLRQLRRVLGNVGQRAGCNTLQAQLRLLHAQHQQWHGTCSSTLPAPHTGLARSAAGGHSVRVSDAVHGPETLAAHTATHQRA